MSPRDRGTLGLCAYCGLEDFLTKDHIPPKSLFASPRPANLITVPACMRCNAGASKDDEYLCLVLSLSEEVDGNPDAAAAKEHSLRALGKIRKTGFARRFFRTVREIDDVSPAGLYLGKKGSYQAEGKRLQRIAERMIRGLFYHETKQVMPANCEVMAFSTRTLDIRRMPPQLLDLYKATLQQLIQSRSHVKGSLTFDYRCAFSPNSGTDSLWLIAFYGRFFFVGAVRMKKGDT